MLDHSSYDYAILRVVPRVERGEYINVGAILFCRTQSFLDALIELDEKRLLALAPDIDLVEVRRQLETLLLTCVGKAEASYFAHMSLAERFHWLVSPRSAIIQTSPVHSGLCGDPATALKGIVRTMVSLSPLAFPSGS
jgi:hypothetical protein